MIINIRKKIWFFECLSLSLLLSKKRKKKLKKRTPKNTPKPPHILTIILSSRSLGKRKFFCMCPFLHFYTGENFWNEENKTIWWTKGINFQAFLRGWSQKLLQWLITVKYSWCWGAKWEKEIEYSKCGIKSNNMDTVIGVLLAAFAR